MPKKQAIKYSVGFFPGVWDLFHNGHLRAIQEAKTHCDYLIIGVNMNPTKGNPAKNEPIMTWEERAEIVRGIKGVDIVMPYSDDDTVRRLDKISDCWDVRFVGEDHKPKHGVAVPVVYISRKHNYSSRNLRKRVYEAESSINGR